VKYVSSPLTAPPGILNLQCPAHLMVACLCHLHPASPQSLHHSLPLLALLRSYCTLRAVLGCQSQPLLQLALPPRLQQPHPCLVPKQVAPACSHPCHPLLPQSERVHLPAQAQLLDLVPCLALTYPLPRAVCVSQQPCCLPLLTAPLCSCVCTLMTGVRGAGARVGWWGRWACGLGKRNDPVYLVGWGGGGCDV
jgi:hypothetical protein